MLSLGQVIKFNGCHQVVVMVNDCRAVIVPLGNRDIHDPEAVYRQEDSGANSISPNSLLETLGRVAGRVREREVIRIRVKNEAVPDQVVVSQGPKPVVKRDIVLPSLQSMIQSEVDLIETASRAASQVADLVK